MISLAAVSSASDAAGYYARDNYYTADAAEETSAWAGEGAAALGLSGPVDTERFERVLAGALPDGTILDAKRGDHRPGWDMTMSVSKSVSLVALMGDKRLVDAVRQASAVTLSWVERNLAEARASAGGRQQAVRTGNLVAATFLHDVNRSNEPQLHVHTVIANATQRPDGQWRALRSDALYDNQRVTGAVFNAALRARVEALGYRTEPARNPTCGAFEIAGVPRAVIDAFSSRSGQVEAYLRERGLEGTPHQRELAVLATRDPKEVELPPEQRAGAWAALAERHGWNPKEMVAEALKRDGRGETVWTQLMRGLRGAGERGLAIAGRMGLTPRDGDPLVPERLGRLDPRAYAAAQAVASAARELGETEAAFSRLDLIHLALERGGPVTVDDVEARLGVLEAKGLLLGDGDRMLTTESAVRLEQDYLGAIAAGRGQSAPIVPVGDAAARAQEAARELGLRRLNLGQEAAAVLMLSSSDRVVHIQGGPGRGKSAALAPVTAIAKAEGRNVIGLAIANKKANELGRETGAEASTIRRFLGRHERVIDGTARPAHVERVTAELRGAIIIVEEASQVGTYDMERLVRLAEITGAARLIQTGDTRQLGAIDAGKPFEESQKAGHATVHITENLRSRSVTMKAVVAALDAKDLSGVFDLLRPVTTEVAGGDVAGAAAAHWAALPKEERDGTLLLTAGRAMRTEANLAVQAELKAAGEIAPSGVRFDVLDRVNIGREGARLMKGYQPDRIVEIRTDLPSQGLARGDRGTVIGIEGDRVRLAMRGGGEKLFRPAHLSRNLTQDAVTIYERKEIALHAGDRIRWTDTDRKGGLVNAELARVEEVERGRLVVSSLTDGTVQELRTGDRMLERLDLAYAINVHVAQGVTTNNGILALRSTEGKLINEKSFLVGLTRVADRVALVVDDARRMERGVSRNPGDKMSALDVLRRAAGGETIRVPESASTVDAALKRYAELFLAAERMQDEGRALSATDLRALADAAAVLDRERAGGAEDLRVVLDRSPELARDGGKAGALLQAWAEEGQARTDPDVYADRFVADWVAVKTALDEVTGSRGEARSERRLERLEERMEHKLDLQEAIMPSLPERQLGLDL